MFARQRFSKGRLAFRWLKWGCKMAHIKKSFVLHVVGVLVGVGLPLCILFWPVTTTQAQTHAHPGSYKYVVDTTPGPIPTSLTPIMTACAAGTPSTPTCLGPGQDAFVCYIDLEGAGQSITVQDKQPTPVPWFNNTLGTGGNLVTWLSGPFSDATCRRMVGGVSWVAGSTGATGYVTIKYN
jgi:hypothetical protein